MVFTNEKGELMILTTKQDYMSRKVCFLTTKYGQNEFAELQIEKYISDHRFEGHHGKIDTEKFFFLPQLMAI